MKVVASSMSVRVPKAVAPRDSQPSSASTSIGPAMSRCAQGVVPTELGLRLEPEVRAFRETTQRVLDRSASFDPRRAEGRLYIATTEYFELVVGHGLLAELREAAPGVQLCFLDAFGGPMNRALETGQVDLVIAGFFPGLAEGLSRRRLFRDEFATLAGGRLPADRPLTLEEYLAAPHLLITLTGDFDGRVDQALRAMGRARRVAAGTASFATPLWLLRSEDLVLTAPARLLARYGEVLGCRAQPPPLALSGVDMGMVWHPRSQRDPLRQFLRERIVARCKALAPAPGAGASSA